MLILSIIIPAYNEERTIERVLNSVAAAPLPPGVELQLVVVNDFSTDGTAGLVGNWAAAHPQVSLLLLSHEKNLGKGAGIHTGIGAATGDYILVQDADLEYDPNEYGRLLEPVVKGFADVVFGSRFVGSRPHRVLLFHHYMANKLITFLSNLFTNLNLTDIETCYKLFNASMLKSLRLREKRFGFEPEVTAKISRIPGVRIYEVGISYYGRTYAEGKKIGWRDGLKALWCILKYNTWAKR